MAVRFPIVPNTITVHLGKPDEASKNVTVLFTDYISIFMGVVVVVRMLGWGVTENLHKGASVEDA